MRVVRLGCCRTTATDGNEVQPELIVWDFICRAHGVDLPEIAVEDEFKEVFQSFFAVAGFG
jgi:hypothetical protein